MERVIENKPSNTSINAASGKVVSVNTIFNTIQSLLKTSVTPTYKPAETLWNKFDAMFKGEYSFKHSCVSHDVLKYTLGDTLKAKSIYNWIATTSLNDGIKQILEQL